MRTIEQITADMEVTQSQLPELAALNSTSDVSYFGLLKSMWVLLVSTLEQRWDAIQADLTALLAAGQMGSLTWYVNQVKAFQYGDQVTVYDGVRVGYATVDVSKRIVQQANLSEQPDGRLLLKVAKPAGLENGPLTEPELIALKEYVRQIKYAGVSIDTVSLPADRLKLVATIKYDKQVFNEQGQFVAEPSGRRPVLEAIIIYIRALPFDSVLNWNKLTDFVMTLQGVQDFQISQAYIRPDGSPTWIEFTRETTSRAGHLALDAESIFTYV
jgi:hypothetical protein